MENELPEEETHGDINKAQVSELLDKPDRGVDSKFPEGGYGWFVVLGCFLSHLVSGGIERSEGVFFLQFLERFEESTQLTSWPGAIMSTLNLCLGPVASIICNRFSVRTSVMVAGLLVGMGILLNGMATNFYFLFFSHAFLVGVGRGLSYAPGLIIVGMYFEKRRGLATGIGSSGVGVGTFLLVPLAQFLFDYYGYQGAFLIFGAITFNINVSAMLYRPLTMHSRFLGNLKRTDFNISLLDVAEAIIQSETISEIGSIRSLPSSSFDERGSGLQKLRIQKAPQANVANISGNKSNSFSCHKMCFTSSLKILFPTETRTGSNKDAGKLCHFYLLKNPSFLLFCLSIWLFTMAMKAAFMFIPALVKFKGNTEVEASLVLSITGAVDCFARIAAGFILDTRVLKPYRPMIYSGVMFAVAIVAFLLPSMESLESIIVLCCFYGLFTGTYVAQKSVILVDILGLQHLANSLGLLICFQSLGTLLGPPVAGALRDHFGSFTQSFYLGGCFMVAAGVVMVTSNICMKMKGRGGKSYV